MSTEARTWRLLDSGVRTAAEHMALDQAILSARSKGLVPTTVRFLQFSPPAALLGAFQTPGEELRLDYCESNGIDVNRRLTGGGTIYFDESQLGWELICGRDEISAAPTVEHFRRLCEPMVAALKKLGLSASFRPRNDIEIDGKKISGTGGTEEGEAFLFQGTLLTDFDVDAMLRALRVPVEKLKRKEIDSLKERVTCLAWELGESPPIDELKSLLAGEFEREFSVRLVPGALTSFEEEELEKLLPRFSSDAWIRKERVPPSKKDYLRGYARTRSGVLKASVVFDAAQQRLEYVVFTGDFFAFPGRAVYDLEAALKGVPREDIGEIVKDFIKGGSADFAGLGHVEFRSAIDDALDRSGHERYGIVPGRANNVFSIIEPMERIVGIGATVLLLPYCAKPLDCGFRYDDECTMCGRCEVGTAYLLGRKLGLEVRTIVSFEHLMETLSDMKRRGVPAFVGSCCEAFYLKHRDEIERHGVPGVLVDVGSDTCYDLGRTREAYAGAFEGETALDMDLVATVTQVCAGLRIARPGRAKTPA